MLPDELKTIVAHLKTGSCNGPRLEIGTAYGTTLRQMIPSHLPGIETPPFVVVDTMDYFPNQPQIVRDNLQEVGIDPDWVDIRQGRSWGDFFKARDLGETFSFIFIDGSHKMKHVMQDLLWTRLLAVDGIVCLHDYELNNTKGVVRAADRFLKQNPNYEIISQVNTLLSLRKTRDSTKPEVTWFDLAISHVLSFFHQQEKSIAKRLKKKKKDLR